MFEHVLIPVTPSGGLIVWKAKERACPARRAYLVFVFGRDKVKLERKSPCPPLYKRGIANKGEED
jgi:hypothetical protein